MALPAVGTPAPTFKAPNLTGPEFNLENYKGKKSVVLIFSTSRTDPPQISAVTQLWKKYREKTEIVTVSFKLPSIAMAKSFLQSLGAKFPALYDPNQAIYKLYGVENPVAILVIDPEGDVAFAAESLETKDVKGLEQTITSYVK